MLLLIVMPGLIRPMVVYCNKFKMTDDTVIENSFGKRIKNFVYNPKDEVGKGFSSVVYKGVNELNKEEIAVKVIELVKIKNEVQKYLLNNEMRALRKLSHPNILRCVDILMTKNNVYIVTEFCVKGDLLGIVKKRGRLPEAQVLKYVRDIVEGYMVIEDNRVLHRDIKTANIFIGSDDVARIADFGFCEFIGEVKPSIPYNVGSPAYMSPESYQESNYSAQSDLWSIGIILFEALVGEVPFKKHEYGELIRNLTSGNLGISPQIPISEATRMILVGCFKEKLSERLTVRRLYDLISTELIAQLREIEGEKEKQRERNISMDSRRSMTGKPKTTGIFSEIARNSQVGDIVGQDANAIFQATNSYLNQLFRLGRLLNENKMGVVKSLVVNVFCIANRNRLQLISDVEGLVQHADPDFRRDHDLIKTRMLELSWFGDKSNPIDPNLRLLHSTPFRSEQNLNGCINYLKFSIKEFDKLIDTDPKNFQNLTCILDYLMMYLELLQLQMTTQDIVEIANTGKILLNVKDRPVTLTDTHLKLLRHKKRILNI